MCATSAGKSLFPPMGVVSTLTEKFKKHAKNDSFSWKIDPKTRPPKILPKNIDFRAFSKVQKGWKPTILKLKSPPQLRTVHFWGFWKSFLAVWRGIQFCIDFWCIFSPAQARNLPSEKTESGVGKSSCCNRVSLCVLRLSGGCKSLARLSCFAFFLRGPARRAKTEH